MDRILFDHVAIGVPKVADGPWGRLVFRWPGSFMRLAGEIDPIQNEGPSAGEITGPCALALPEGPHPAPGAVFTEEEA